MSAPDWPDRLLAALRRAGIPAVRLLASDDALALTLAPDGRPPLEVELRPRTEGGRAYRRTGRFLVSYRGASDLDPQHLRPVDALVELVSRLEHGLPGSWSGLLAAGEASGSPDLELPQRFPFVQLDRSEDRVEALVRITSRCSQRCPFCSAPPASGRGGDVPPADVRACIDRVAEDLPGASVTLTGGEPALHPDLCALAQHALGRPELELVGVQTNAVFPEPEPGRTGCLASLGPDRRLRFFVSLHATDPTIYDRCTGSHGHLPRALDGLRRLLEAGHAVTVNSVACSLNFRHLSAMVRDLRGFIGGLPLPALHWSVLVCPPHRPGAAALLVRYGDLASALEAAHDTARDQGFATDPLLGSTHASLPPCCVSPRHREEGRRPPVVREGETGYGPDPGRQWEKAAACRTCAITGSCLGAPAAYARRFGLAELVAIRRHSGATGSSRTIR